MRKQVMVRAWSLAKEAVKKFGGRAVDFFRSALTIAWSEIKNGVFVEVRTDRAAQLAKSLNVTLKIAERLVEVEKAFQEYWAEEEELEFKIWNNYGKSRAYISCPWYSKYQNSKQMFVDLQTGELHAPYVRA